MGSRLPTMELSSSWVHQAFPAGFVHWGGGTCRRRGTFPANGSRAALGTRSVRCAALECDRRRCFPGGHMITTTDPLADGARVPPPNRPHSPSGWASTKDSVGPALSRPTGPSQDVSVLHSAKSLIKRYPLQRLSQTSLVVTSHATHVDHLSPLESFDGFFHTHA